MKDRGLNGVILDVLADCGYLTSAQIAYAVECPTAIASARLGNLRARGEVWNPTAVVRLTPRHGRRCGSNEHRRQLLWGYRIPIEALEDR